MERHGGGVSQRPLHDKRAPKALWFARKLDEATPVEIPFEQ